MGRPDDLRIVIDHTLFYAPPVALNKYTNYFLGKTNSDDVLVIQSAIRADELTKRGFWLFMEWVEMLTEESKPCSVALFQSVEGYAQDDVLAEQFAQLWATAEKLDNQPFKNFLITTTIDLPWEGDHELQPIIFNNILALLEAGLGDSLPVNTFVESLAYWYMLEDSELGDILSDWQKQPESMASRNDLLHKLLDTVKEFQEYKRIAKAYDPVDHVCRKWHKHTFEENNDHIWPDCYEGTDKYKEYAKNRTYEQEIEDLKKKRDMRSRMELRRETRASNATELASRLGLGMRREILSGWLDRLRRSEAMKQEIIDHHEW